MDISLCDACIWNCKNNTYPVDSCSKYTNKKQYESIEGNIEGNMEEKR